MRVAAWGVAVIVGVLIIGAGAFPTQPTAGAGCAPPVAGRAGSIRAAAEKYGPSVDRVAERYGITGGTLLLKLVEGESGGDPAAVSRAGARGLTQFMPTTRAEALRRFRVDAWGDADDAIHAAALHLRGALGHEPGLLGYNASGGDEYVRYILSQDVAEITSGAGAPVECEDAPLPTTGRAAAIVAAIDRFDRARFPYVWGGGHQGTPAPWGPVDCSGFVSFALQAGGVRVPTMVSGDFMYAGEPGAGMVTVYANPGHVLMSVNGRFAGTSRENPRGGAGWIARPSQAYLARFAVRHFDVDLRAPGARPVSRRDAGATGTT